MNGEASGGLPGPVREVAAGVRLDPNSEVTSLSALGEPARLSAAAAADLLSHWWSRPLYDEVEIWFAYTDLAHQLFGSAPLPDALDEPAVLGMLEEYERLFVGPGPVPCPPFESCWRIDVPFDLRRGLLGPCTAELRELYGRLGFELALPGAEFTDCLPVELEGLTVALSDPEEADVTRSLVVDHLHRWVPQLCDAVRQEARHPFYRDLARATSIWVESLAEIWVAPVDGG